MMNYAYRCLKKRIYEIDGITFEDLPEMKTLQDIMNKSLEYKFRHLEGIDKAECLIEETRTELDMLKQNFGAENYHRLYLVAVDEIAQKVIAITTPIVNALFIESKYSSKSWDRCFEILEDVERIKCLLSQIPDHYLYWKIREQYWYLVRKIPPIERALDKYLQQRIIRSVNCL